MLAEYLISQYKIKKWPFFSLIEVLNHFNGINIHEELKVLEKEKKIRFRDGINGKLIEII